MTNPEYVIEFMQENDFRYWTVSNSFDREINRQFQDMSLEESVRKMKRFLKNNTGFHRIKLFQTNEVMRGGKPRSEPAMFEVTISGKEFEDKPKHSEGAPISGMTSINPSPQGAIVGVDQYLNIHNVNAELKAENEKLKMQLDYMQQNHEKELENLRREMDSKIKEAQDSNAMFGQGISMLMQRMGVGE